MKNLIVGLLFVMTLFVNGCAELRNGDEPSDALTQPRFFFGELRFTEITPFDRAWQGVHTALQELKYTAKSSEHDLLQAHVVAEGDGKTIKIELEETSPTTTEIRIRAGKIGDKALAEHVLATIRKHL